MQNPADEIAHYDYLLPEELIAAHPLARREDSRLMVLDRAAQSITDRRMVDFPALLSPGDCLVLNDTHVVPARLLGHRAGTGGKWEGLFLRTGADGNWRLIGTTRGKLQVGEQISIYPAHQPGSADRLILTLLAREEEGVWLAQPKSDDCAFDLLQRFGTVPLPPYMQRELADEEDWQRYQTVYARHPGSVAAPTAGLHFTPELLKACEERGVTVTFVTLHVGVGTFRPVAVDRLTDHKMHSEWCEVSAETAAVIQAAQAERRRIVAVGTTTVRTLESVAASGEMRAWRGETDLFIRPGFEFRVADAMLTNFHLPKSTLLVLVSALAGTEFVRQAYRRAVDERYRFYSYGDAMLIF